MGSTRDYSYSTGFRTTPVISNKRDNVAASFVMERGGFSLPMRTS